MVRTHALRIAAETGAQAASVRGALTDSDAIVRRVAAEALGRASGDLRMCRRFSRHCGGRQRSDDHLVHVIRIALRDQLRSSAVTGTLPLDRLDGNDLRTLLEIMVAVPGEQNALLRLSLFEKLEVPAEVLAGQLPSLAQNLPVDRLEALGALARQRLSGNLEAQAAVLQSVLQALAQRSAKPGESLRAWGTEVATTLLTAAQTGTGWTAINLDGTAPADVPWTLQDRPCADGKTAQVISSFPRGEKLTGILRSAPFPLPESLRFYVCGHDGDPSRQPNGKNIIRLHDAADGRILREAPVPRQDIAKPVEWQLREFAGRSGYLEVTDADSDGAYAWLAVGRFEPALPQLAWRDPGTMNRGQSLAAEIATQLQLTSLSKPLSALLGNSRTAPELRLAAAKALLSLEPVAPPQIATLLTDESLPFALREKLVTTLGETRSSGDECAPHLCAPDCAAPAPAGDRHRALRFARRCGRPARRLCRRPCGSRAITRQRHHRSPESAPGQRAVGARRAANGEAAAGECRVG